MPTVPDRFGEAGRKRSYFRPAGGTETDGAPFGRRSFPTVSCYEYTIPCPSACGPARWTALTFGPCPGSPATGASSLTARPASVSWTVLRCVNRKDTSATLPWCGCSRLLRTGGGRQLCVSSQLPPVAPPATFSPRVLVCLPTPAWTLLRIPPAQPVPTVRPTGRPSAWPSSPGPTTTSRTASH